MKAFLHHLSYDFKTGFRDKSKLLMYYLFPLAFFAVIGGLMSGINPGFKTTMIPALILFAVMSSALLNIPNLLVGAREAGVFRSFRINGVPSGSILSVPAISTAFHMAVVAVIIIVAGQALFGGVPPTHAVGFVAAAILAYLAFSGVGALIGVAAGNSTASLLLAQLIYIPCIMLGGLMVPASMLPAGFRRGALLLPATHAMNVFVGLGYGTSGAAVPWVSIAVLTVSAIVSYGLAAVLFQWDSRAAQPSRKAWAAVLGLAPFVAAVLIG